MTVGTILILLNLFSLLGTLKEGRVNNSAYGVGYFIGSNLFFFVGAALFYFAYKLDKRIKRKKHSLINDEIENIGKQ